ncbi:hypothetical protein Cgig2_023383 [Carnegiea gigantea]|uniref:Uncharacterized protein n=1 Tax=Carnegiea gigantea TaxID=171969 RepID=A0A9Q1GPR3_9CARY|nr:hypothetical protein Cgig2_023383 [Carnegiea gigantea]
MGLHLEIPSLTINRIGAVYEHALDLRFETATTRIKATPDGEFLIASGIYPPQVKVYELRELSLKFERHLDSEIIDFQATQLVEHLRGVVLGIGEGLFVEWRIRRRFELVLVLSDDYSKLAFLCADRSVCLHAKYGSHYSLRIPRMGRDMTYDCWSCDLLCAASSPDLYRINLAQVRRGEFFKRAEACCSCAPQDWCKASHFCSSRKWVIEEGGKRTPIIKARKFLQIDICLSHVNPFRDESPIKLH